MTEAFILGAGFSRAVNRKMPLMVDLAVAVRSRLQLQADEVPAGVPPSDLEAWLSYLDSEPPWLDEAARLRSRALSIEIREEIGNEIALWDQAAGQEQMPEWLGELVSYWHEHESTVATFNYDLLVERAFCETFSGSSLLDDRGREIEAVWAGSLRPIDVAPAASRSGFAVFAPETVPTFKLLKLHGSVDLLYSGRADPAGEILYEGRWLNGWASEPVPQHVEHVRTSRSSLSRRRSQRIAS